MNVLSLFSGLGAHDLGLERAGMRTVAFCESDPWCRAVLAKHWPGVPCHPDVRRLSGADVSEPVDLVTGGFPCQDISVAGKGAGLTGERSGLWFEYLRIVSELRPRWVLAENVPALRTRGFDTVAAGLEAEGYAVWPVVVGAWAVGAPHRRERVWIVAHSARNCGPVEPAQAGTDRERTRSGGDERMGDTEPSVWRSPSPCWDLGYGDYSGRKEAASGLGAPSTGGVGNADDSRLAVNGSEPGDARPERPSTVGASGEGLADSDGERRGRREQGSQAGGRELREPIAWPAGRGEPQHAWEPPRLVESRLGRNLARASARLDGFARRSRLRALGNANVPHVPEAIGRWILSQERKSDAQGIAA